MGCDFCEVSTTTALYVQCVRHKACNDCFKYEQQRRSAGQPCLLCLRDDKVREKTCKLKAKILREASMESVLDGTPKSELSAQKAPDDLDGLNDELEHLLTVPVAPPAGTLELLMATYMSDPHTTEVPSGVCPPPSSTETSPRVNSEKNGDAKGNALFCPYPNPKHKAKRPGTFITQDITEDDDVDDYEFCLFEPPQTETEFPGNAQDMSKDSDLKQEYNEDYYSDNEFRVDNSNTEYNSHDRVVRVGNLKRQLGRHIKEPIAETELADDNDQHVPLCPRSEWEEGSRASPYSSHEDQPQKVAPANHGRISPETGRSLEQRLMLKKGKAMLEVRNWKQASCISISGDIDDEDLDLTDLEKKISVINLQAPHDNNDCHVRPHSVRRWNPRSKSEHSLASLEEGQEHLGSEHDLRYLGRHEPTGELAQQQYQQKQQLKGLLDEWARKQETREKQQTKDAKQTTFEKNLDGDPRKGNSDGDTPPIKGVPKETSACSESPPVKTEEETLDVGLSSGRNSSVRVAREDSAKEALMVALRAAVREEDEERFGCEGLPDPEDFWI